MLVGLALVLAGLGILFGKEEEAEEPAGSDAITRADVERVARRVERIRELEFERLPRASARVGRAGARRRARGVRPQLCARPPGGGGAPAELLGLLPPGPACARPSRARRRRQLAGFYVPRTGALAAGRGPGAGRRARRGGAGARARRTRWRTSASASTRALPGCRARPRRRRRRAARGHGDGGDGRLPAGRARASAADGRAARARAGADRRRGDPAGRAGCRATSARPWSSPTRPARCSSTAMQGEGGWAAVDRAFGDRPPALERAADAPREVRAGERPVARAAACAACRAAGGRPRSPARRRGRVRHRAVPARGQRRGAARPPRRRAGAAARFELWRLPGGGDLLAMAWAWDSERDAARVRGRGAAGPWRASTPAAWSCASGRAGWPWCSGRRGRLRGCASRLAR